MIIPEEARNIAKTEYDRIPIKSKPIVRGMLRKGFYAIKYEGRSGQNRTVTNQMPQDESVKTRS